MFNRKLKEKVKWLEEELKQKDKYISLLNAKIEAIEDLESKTPDDCIFGNYCEVCQLVKVFNIIREDNSGNRWNDKIFVCGKSEACPNFVMKPNVKEG